MTALLASSTATSATATEGDVKTYIANLRTFIADLLGSDSANKAAVHGLLGSVLNGKVTKTSSYTVVESDRGKVIDCTGTWTLSITAASTLGDGFTFALRNSGTGAITIDPNLSETINGLSSFVIGGGEFVIIYCDGLRFSTAGGSSAPAGSISAYGGSSVPVGWLECNGAVVSRTTYSTLFTAIGTTFGAGDGSNTFGIPDLRGEFIRGWDHGKGTDSGRSLGTAQSDDIKSHTHSVPWGSSQKTTISSGAVGMAIDQAGPTNTGATGGGETRPRNISMMYIIKT